MKERALVLYSGGLDSRLVVKILQEKGYDIEAIHFNLPFGCGCCDLGCNFNFTQKENVKLTMVDASKGKLLDEYIGLLKNPKHGTGKGVNPCRDCKIWMFKKAKEYADKNNIKVIATGEVLGQRPMSQTGHAMRLIEEEIGFTPVRPLMELGIKGRGRKKQMELAEKYGIKYPSPGGGCLLCDKILAKRFRRLLDKDMLNEDNLILVNLGRHFFIDDVWYIVARDGNEGRILEKFGDFIEDEKGLPVVWFDKGGDKKIAKELQEAYRTGAEKDERDKFSEFKI
jgi:PP-loop superfamily ATP-utilizing enzyme